MSPADPAQVRDPLIRATAIGLGAGRLAIGAGIWLAPSLAGRALGFGSLDPPALALGRLAASRDLVLGGWQLASLGKRSSLHRSSLALALVDAGDALSFAALILGQRDPLRSAALRGLAASLPAALAGAWLSRRLARRT